MDKFIIKRTTRLIDNSEPHDKNDGIEDSEKNAAVVRSTITPQNTKKTSAGKK